MKAAKTESLRRNAPSQIYSDFVNVSLGTVMTPVQTDAPG
jgi:hypothetical protein